MKNYKAYALIATSTTKEVNRHISYIDDSWNALKKLRELYDSQFWIGVTTTLIKLFNL